MPVNIREIARLAGVSPAAASLALRGAGRISEKTRKKVQDVALSLNYHAHPLLSKALSLARQPEVSRYRETLAMLTEFSLEDPNLDPFPLYQKKIHEGVTEQALNLGYKMESFTLSGKPSEHRRLGRILQARGIRGLIIIPRVEHNQPRLYFEWEKFASVEIGRTLWHPRNLHHVETADYHKTIESLHLLKKAGYRRIGMAIEPAQNKHQRGTYYAAFLLNQMRQPQRQRIPILATTGTWSEKTFRQWMKQHQPDVLFIQDTTTIPVWLKTMGLSVPKDVSLFCVNAQNEKWSGLRRDYVNMGRSAVEMLSLLLEGGKLGLVDNPRSWLVDEFWQPGSTLSHSIAPYLSPEGFLLPGQIHHSHR